MALYGATGYLEATRRALNVVFDAHHGRSFVRRKLTDIASTVVLLTLVLATVVLMSGVSASFVTSSVPVPRWCGGSRGGRQLSSAHCSSFRFSIS